MYAETICFSPSFDIVSVFVPLRQYSSSKFLRFTPQQNTIELSSGSEFTMSLDDSHSTCPPAWVNPCLDNNGGCKDQFSECKAVGCSSEVVCAKCVGAVDKDGNCKDDDDDSDSTMLYAFAIGGVGIMAACGIVYAVTKKKKPEPTADPVEP